MSSARACTTLCLARVVHLGNRLGAHLWSRALPPRRGCFAGELPKTTGLAGVRATLLSRSGGCAAFCYACLPCPIASTPALLFAATTTSWPLRPSPCINNASVNMVAASSGSAPHICPRRRWRSRTHVQTLRLTVRARSAVGAADPAGSSLSEDSDDVRLGMPIAMPWGRQGGKRDATEGQTVSSDLAERENRLRLQACGSVVQGEGSACTSAGSLRRAAHARRSREPRSV
jgi:hypothetical protein